LTGETKLKQLHITALFLSFSLCCANDGHTVETGSAINFSKSRYVQMVSEDIRIWLDDEKSRVQVDFVFKNHGPRHTVTMGFPDQGDNVDLPTMENVRSTVDGVRATLTFRDRTKRTEDDPNPDVVEGVWTKRVPFAKGESKRVRFSYTVKHGGNTSNETYAHYILKTGATWRGKIVMSRITVDWSQVRKRRPPIIREDSEEAFELVGDNWTYGNNRAVGVYRNFIPDFDLKFDMLPSFGHIVLNGELREHIYPPLLMVGHPADLRLPISALPKFFEGSGPNGENMYWGNPCTAAFGGSISFPDSKTMLLGGRRRVTLKRPVVVKQGKLYGSMKGVQFVYLKDVVEGVGGSYLYDPKSTRLNINIPK
jgi:hypothetical protein